MKHLYVLFFLLPACAILAQDIWEFPTPQVASGPYAIMDTVYISPAGDDSNPGTQNMPVASFQKALQLLPFGTAGVNGGHAYGLIRLLPGKYITNGFQQPSSQYQQGNTFKNVSLEGIGEVSVEGKRDSFATGHLIRLRGSHIFIKNLKLRYSKIHGIFISGQSRINNVLIDGVVVDSVQSFCMLFHEVDTVLVRNSKALHGSRPGSDSLTSGCQWPSGIKFYDCTRAVIHDSEVAYTRGEGLNFHNSEYGLAYNNHLHDNPTNLYCDNSARIVIRNNFNYATPGNTIYWRTCPAATHPIYGSKGILLANESACTIGGPVYQNCRSVCNFQNKSYPQIDSIFIYNNLFVNTTPALNLWQGNTEVLQGFNCMRNVFFHHNTIVGATGDPAAGNAAMIYGFFPNVYNTLINQGFAVGENINIFANIISYDINQFPSIQPIRIARDINFPVPFELNVSHNRVIETDDELTATDQVDSTMPTSVDPIIDSVLKHLQPCSENLHWVQSAPATAWIEADFSYKTRMSNPNLGALEYQLNCIIIDTTDTTDTTDINDTIPNSVINQHPVIFSIYPNPATESVWLYRNLSHEKMEITCTDLVGKILVRKEWPVGQSTLQIPVNQLPGGLIFVTLTSPSGTTQTLRFLKY